MYFARETGVLCNLIAFAIISSSLIHFSITLNTVAAGGMDYTTKGAYFEYVPDTSVLYRYKRIQGNRLNYTSSYVIVNTSTACTLHCHKTESCYAVSYNSARKLCYLCDKWLFRRDISIVLDDSWDIYYSLGKTLPPLSLSLSLSLSLLMSSISILA